jgi:hypothetical protein
MVTKAQSAMEYLMTYGWAILIIAVVLAALYSLGIFTGSSLAGASCIASPGYYCQNIALNSAGLLSFTFGQNTGTQIYNIQLACGATATTGGEPGNSAGWSFILSNGLAVNTINNANLNNGIDLATAETVQVVGLQCYGPTNAAIANGVIGTTYSGYVWLNYTSIACFTLPCNTLNGDPWYTTKPLSLTTKIV